MQHLNGFEFKYSRIFLHQLSIMYFTIWWNWNGLESTYSGIILHDWSIMYCTIWCNLLMASNPSISTYLVYLSHLKTFGHVKLFGGKFKYFKPFPYSTTGNWKATLKMVCIFNDVFTSYWKCLQILDLLTTVWNVVS